MHPTDSTSFDYSIIEFEPFQEIVDTYENDSLFKDSDEKNGTIDLRTLDKQAAISTS